MLGQITFCKFYLPDYFTDLTENGGSRSAIVSYNSLESPRADAGVRVGSGVDAGGPVAAGVVPGAVVRVHLAVIACSSGK